MEKEVRNINNSKALFVPADKTTNVYEIEKGKYEQLLTDSIHTQYHKDKNNSELKINTEAKRITETLELDDRVEILAKKQCYISIKDHKDNFMNNTKCRLINPTKSNIGKISKQLLQKINEEVREKEKLQQWRSTTDVLEWFNTINNKANKQFLQLDIVEYYPSITEKLLNKAIEWAAKITQIKNSTKSTIKHSCQSILFHKNKAWIKNNGTFDIAQGAFHSAEVCELVGLYILKKVKDKFPILNFGIYRDDALATHNYIPGPELERMKKELQKLFKTFDLKINIETNMKIVNFLDVTIDLNSGTYKPFTKPNKKYNMYTSNQTIHHT